LSVDGESSLFIEANLVCLPRAGNCSYTFSLMMVVSVSRADLVRVTDERRASGGYNEFLAAG